VVEDSSDVRVQEAAINVFSTIKKYLDDDTMTKLLLPKAKSLFTKSSAVRVRSVYMGSCENVIVRSVTKLNTL